MKIYFSLLILILVCCFAASAQRTYVGSTPAHGVVRNFLQISLTDSIDFIRWKLAIGPSHYELQCQYGLAKAGTPGFENEKRVVFEGELSKTENRCYLHHKGKRLSILQVNADLLHLLDQNNHLLVGNGGYSYALNSTAPVKTNQFNIQSELSTTKAPLVFEGRTPCQELSTLLGLNKSDACNKMKWYIIFYTDSVTGKPSYYLKGGIGYRKETMERGKWQIINKDGRIIYQVNPDDRTYTLYLLKGDDNILFFIDPDGRLLVGNEDFSYTLNRREKEYPPVRP
jgi:hypothetical protein